MVNSQPLIPSFLTLWQEAKKGKSIARILTNLALARWRDEVKGIVLDLACGKKPSYQRFLHLIGNDRVQVIGVDVNPSYCPTVVADLTHPLPFKTESIDVVILSSFFYIPPDPERILQEVRRVLKNGALLLLTAPLVFHYNPEPTDHWRFTEEGLKRLLSRSGLLVEELIPIGERWTAAAYLLSPFLRPRWLVAPIVYWLCLKLDAWTVKKFKRLPRCPIGYVVKARKAK